MVKNVKILVNGKEVTGGIELISGDAVKDYIELLEYTPKLIEIDADGI